MQLGFRDRSPVRFRVSNETGMGFQVGLQLKSNEQHMTPFSSSDFSVSPLSPMSVATEPNPSVRFLTAYCLPDTRTDRRSDTS